MIITDITKLRSIAEDCISLEEGKEIAMNLFKEIAQQKTAPALAATQIGVNKRVIALNIREPLYFVNPKIIEYFKDSLIPYLESDSSFPQMLCHTARYASIRVSADNLTQPILIGPDPDEQINKLTVAHPVVMESAYFQQAYDHLEGITMWDKELQTNIPITRDEPKIHRNEKIKIAKEGIELEIKYKKLNNFLNLGWKLLDSE